MEADYNLVASNTLKYMSTLQVICKISIKQMRLFRISLETS